VSAPGGRTCADSGASASMCYSIAAWALELDMRQELAPFEVYWGSSQLTDSHMSAGGSSSASTPTGNASAETGYEMGIGFITA